MRCEQHGETADAATLREQLRHVHWIGGGSGAGKSIIARRLAVRHGLWLYATDEVISDHDGHVTPQDAPLLSRFKAMDMDERWVNRSPKTMLESFHWFQGEMFGLIVDDLPGLPAEPGVIVEGFRLLPPLVKPLLAVPDHAVWLLPTPGFAGLRSIAGARCGRSLGRPVIRPGPCTTCSSAMRCSPNASARRRSVSNCASSRSISR
jgi:hypothetical protein